MPEFRLNIASKKIGRVSEFLTFFFSFLVDFEHTRRRLETFRVDYSYRLPGILPASWIIAGIEWDHEFPGRKEPKETFDTPPPNSRTLSGCRPIIVV